MKRYIFIERVFYNIVNPSKQERFDYLPTFDKPTQVYDTYGDALGEASKYTDKNINAYKIMFPKNRNIKKITLYNTTSPDIIGYGIEVDGEIFEYVLLQEISDLSI